MACRVLWGTTTHLHRVQLRTAPGGNYNGGQFHGVHIHPLSGSSFEWPWRFPAGMEPWMRLSTPDPVMLILHSIRHLCCIPLGTRSRWDLLGVNISLVLLIMNQVSPPLCFIVYKPSVPGVAHPTGIGAWLCGWCAVNGPGWDTTVRVKGRVSSFGTWSFSIV